METIKNVALCLCLAFVTAGLFSCTKIAESSSVSVETITDNCDCRHITLIHHEAVPAGATTCGNIEYWECSSCKEVFLDGETRQPYSGYVYIMPTNFVKDISALSILNPAKTKAGVANIVELIFSTIDCAMAVSSMVMSIESYNHSMDGLNQAIDELEKKTQKTDEEIQKINEYNQALQNSVSNCMATLDTLSQTLSAIKSQMSDVEIGLAAIDKSLRSILGQVQELEANLRMQNLMDNRQVLINSLYQSSTDAFIVLEEYISETQSVLDTCSDDRRLAVLSNFADNQQNVVRSWGECEGNHLGNTLNLLNTFIQVSYNQSETFPFILKEYAENHIAWEHHGYSFREMMLEKDMFVMGLSFNLAKMYYSISGNIDPEYGRLQANHFDSLYNNVRYIKTRDSLAMVESYGNYRYCNATGNKFSVEPGCWNGEDILSGNIDKGVTSITKEDIESVEQYFYGQSPTVQNVYFSVGEGGLELDDIGGTKVLTVPSAAFLNISGNSQINSHVPKSNSGSFYETVSVSGGTKYIFPMYYN